MRRRRFVRRRRFLRRRRRRLIRRTFRRIALGTTMLLLLGGTMGAIKLRTKDAEKIKQETGKSPEEMTEEELVATMKKMGSNIFLMTSLLLFKPDTAQDNNQELFGLTHKTSVISGS